MSISIAGLIFVMGLYRCVRTAPSQKPSNRSFFVAFCCMYRSGDSAGRLLQVDATAVVRLQRVGWAGCAAQAPNGILHSLLRSEVSAHVYGLPVVRAVIDLKWCA